MPQTIFINEENKLQYKQQLLVWLESDFYRRGEPSPHFWPNQTRIASAFDNCTAMIVLNDQKEIIGYMTWFTYDGGAEINIVEVREDCRRQGIFRKMLSEFSNKFTDVFLLSTSALPQSEEIFRKLGWGSAYDLNRQKKLFRIVGPVLCPLDTLPNGRAIAIFSKFDEPKTKEHIDFYVVRANLGNYRVKYFQIDLDEERKLRVPIVTAFHYEGYVGVYFNKNLITEGKAKHLFNNRPCHSDLLVLDRFEPIDLDPFNEKGFFSQLRQETSDQEGSSSSEVGSSVTLDPTAEATSSSERPQKRRRTVEPRPTLFQPSKSVVKDEEVGAQTTEFKI